MKKLTFLTAILLATTTFAQIPNYVPTNGLVGWWPFNGNTNDESGNGNNGTVNGATLTTDRNGVANKAYSFDGVSNNIIAPNSNSLNVNELSISVWYLANGNQMSVIAKNNQTDCSQYSFGIHHQSTWNSFGPSLYTSTGIGNCNSSSRQEHWGANNIVPSNQWVLIVYTINNVGESKTYMNGSLLESYTGQNITSCNSLSSTLRFGGPHWDDNPLYFQGKIDDIGIWNRALTDCEIKNLYNGGVPNSSQTQTALDTYTWPVNNQTYTQSGTYSDTLVNAAGCDSIVTLNLTLSYTGINELNTSQLVVSPNPTKDNFSISGLELLGTITSLEIKDAAGKVVKVIDPTTTNFSCIGLKAGVYFLAVTSNKTERVIKIIKE
jgi:hypothetical protein